MCTNPWLSNHDIVLVDTNIQPEGKLLRGLKIQKTSQEECWQHGAEDNKNNKRLYAFVKSKKCDSSGEAPLMVNVKTHDSPGKRQISSTRAADLDIRVEGVTKILKGLSPHKASGPDQISSRVLNEMATEISPAYPNNPGIGGTRSYPKRMENSQRLTSFQERAHKQSLQL